MFTSFFYTMRSNGLNISTTEWLTLMDALDKDLAHSNFTDFYYLCRTIFVKMKVTMTNQTPASQSILKILKTKIKFGSDK